MPRIFVLSGPDVGASRDVPSGATLGRADDCTLPLHDASVSRRHARIEQRGSSWHVVDAGSRNGVFVRGERVEEAELADGEEFLLGEVLVRFRVSTDAPTAPASPSSPPVAARPIVARPPAPPVAADEIVLEGDWDESAAAAAAARAGQRLVSAESAAPARPERPVEAPSAARAKAEERLRAAGVLPKASAAGARGVLQYHKVEGQAGALSGDLDQVSFARKLIVALVAIVVLAAVAWLAFRGGALLRGSPEPGDGAPAETPVETAPPR